MVAAESFGQADGRRVDPPDWNNVDTSDIFFEDAFVEALGGRWPIVQRSTSSKRTSAKPPSGVAESADAGNASNGDDWSEEGQAAALIGEIVRIAGRLPAMSRNGRKYQEVHQQEFERDVVVASCLFKILDHWPSEVRFQDQAAAASSYLAEWKADAPGHDAKAARALSDRMTDLARGNSAFADPKSTVSWSEVVDREFLMWRIEIGLEEKIDAAMASEKSFRAGQSQLEEELWLMEALFAALRQPAADDADQPEYVDFCRDTEDALQRFREQVRLLDHQSGVAEWNRLKQSCTNCHESFR